MFNLVICPSVDIAATASFYAKSIIENRACMDAIIESIHVTGVSRVDYSRSVALLARHVQIYLNMVDRSLAQEFRKKLVDAAIDVFFEFWVEFLGFTQIGDSPKSNALAAANAVALCAFMGDLRHAGFISFGTYEWCLTYLMHRVSARSHLRYLYALFRHGCSQQRPEVSAKYLFRCMDTVRVRCARILGTVPREEHDLRELLSHLATIARTPGGYWPDVVDRRLDLDDALMASVCDQDEAHSSGPSTVSSTSSVTSAGSSKIVEMPELQHPRPVYGWQRFMQS